MKNNDWRDHTHALSNGRYTVRLSAAGTGFSALGDIALTRWIGDRIEDRDGHAVYIRDLESGAFWSVGQQPICNSADRYAAAFHPDRVEIARSDDGIDVDMTVCVSPDNDLEIRRLTIVNRSGRARRLDLTSYVEVVLAPQAADTAHPAFSKLFVQTAWDGARRALVATRRRRGADEATVCAASWLVAEPSLFESVEVESDRALFLGRGGSPSHPKALTSQEPLSGSVGNVLDPIFGLRCALNLKPDEQRTITIGLTAADSPENARAIVDRHAHADDVERVFSRAKAEKGNDAERIVVEGRNPSPPRFVPVDEHPTRSIGPARSMAESLLFDNGHGGFSPEGDEYVIRVGAEQRPPLPWTHVVANEAFGFIASESGAGFTWAVNSRLNRLTPWYNDPVGDPHGEALYIRDEDAGVFWSPQPGPVASGADYTVRYAFGTCRYAHTSSDLQQDVLMFVPRGDPVKLTHISVHNLGNHDRRLSVFAYYRLVLGDQSTATEGAIETWRDEETGAILARNSARADFADRVTFAAVMPSSGGGDVSMTTDRASFIGKHGGPGRPAALMHGDCLDGVTGTLSDACFALQLPIKVAAGEVADCVILLGEASDADSARTLILKYRDVGAVDSALDEVRGFWRDTLTAVQVKTPSPAIDVMANGWLLYQLMSCRLWARSAFYQSGGAFGFRDQLQDSAALAFVRPDMTRNQILLHAAHQFGEGDVLHWWHPPLSRGIRTRFSDDLVWLPFVTALYIEATGDRGILDESEPFMTARPLAAGEDEAYLLPTITDETATIYEHCCRVLDRSLTKGAHGLPLMGTGDWNDGMNRVGREGRGESVWMGFFIHHVLTHFISLCLERNDTDRAATYQAYRAHLAVVLNDTGWDGAWYRRAYYDDGTPLGSAESTECRIDALAQAWAVISGVAPSDRVEQALDALEEHLISDRDRLIRLLAPPFVNTPHDPGYIKGYVAGVRENGGQYTHAALWVVQAMAKAGRADRAAELLEMLTPINHALTRESADHYKVEPYVVAADVYGAAPHVGRGGWTWYTGAAGWMYQVILKSLLGFAMEGGDTIVLSPSIPPSWLEFDLRYRCPDGRTTYDIRVRNAPNRTGAALSATVDGREIAPEAGKVRVPLQTDGATHLIKAEVS